MDVELLHWPGERQRRERLRANGRPRLLLVEHGVEPPTSSDLLEDWIRVPAARSDVRARIDGILRRAEFTADAEISIDDTGSLLPGRVDSRSDHYPSRSEGHGRQEFYRHHWSPIGRLSAVIDFGGVNVGDPACDLQPAWYLYAGASRDRFRAELQVDDASWLRGRG